MNFTFSYSGSASTAFSEEEVLKIDNAITLLQEACTERSEALEVVSTFLLTRSGPEYQVIIYDNGVPASELRVHRDLYSSEVVFTRVWGCIGQRN